MVGGTGYGRYFFTTVRSLAPLVNGTYKKISSEPFILRILVFIVKNLLRKLFYSNTRTTRINPYYINKRLYYNLL